MAKTGIKHNIPTEVERIKKIAKDFEERGRIGVMNCLNQIAFISSAKYLQGPRPEQLDMVSGRLMRAILGGHAFGGGKISSGSASISTKDGYQKAHKKGNTFWGEIGVDFTNKYGFDYAEYWEERGTSHGGPRSFLRPAGEQANSSGILNIIMQQSIDKVKLD